MRFDRLVDRFGLRRRRLGRRHRRASPCVSAATALPSAVSGRLLRALDAGLRLLSTSAIFASFCRVRSCVCFERLAQGVDLACSPGRPGSSRTPWSRTRWCRHAKRYDNGCHQ